MGRYSNSVTLTTLTPTSWELAKIKHVGTLQLKTVNYLQTLSFRVSHKMSFMYVKIGSNNIGTILGHPVHVIFYADILISLIKRKIENA